MPINPDHVPTLVNLSPQLFIIVIVNIPPTIDAPTFANPLAEFFEFLG
jgi:hypothetical protein